MDFPIAAAGFLVPVVTNFAVPASASPAALGHGDALDEIGVAWPARRIFAAPAALP